MSLRLQDIKPTNWIRLGTGRTGVSGVSKASIPANVMDHDDLRGCCSLPADPWADDAVMLGRRSTTSLQFPTAALEPSFVGGPRDRYPSRNGDDSISTQMNFPGCDQGSTTHDFHGHVHLHHSQPINPRCHSPSLEDIFLNAFDNNVREAPQPRQRIESEHGCSQSLCAVTSRDLSDSLASADEGKAKSGGGVGKRKRHDIITEDLTPEEARRRRRMLSNRESARRSRLRKQGQLQEMEESMKKLQKVNDTLTQMLNDQRVEHENLTQKVHALHSDNENLRKQVTMLAKYANVSVNLPPPTSPTC